MAITRHRAIEHTDKVFVSEASTRDARPANAVKYGCFRDEWIDLVKQKVEIQRRLSEANRRASKDNLAIRARHNDGPEGAREWLSVKGTIEIEQNRLADELHKVEDRMQAIKYGVQREKQRDATSHDPFHQVRVEQNGLLQEILAELQAVREIVEKKT